MINISPFNSVIVIQFDNTSTNQMNIVWVCESREAHDRAKADLEEMSHITNIRSSDAHVAK